MLIQQVLNGLIVGSVYAIFSLGFTLVFGVLNILNLAHGGVFMWGAFVGLYAVSLAHLPLPIAFLLAVIVAGVLSVLIELFVFRPMRARNSDEFGRLVASIGANLILISVAQQVSQARIYGFPFGTFPIKNYELLGLRVSLLQFTVMGCLLVMAGALFYYIYMSPFGRQVRAVAVSERTSQLLGVNSSAVYLRTFFIAGALAGAAGVMIGVALNSVQFLMGEPMMLRAFVVVILAGMGSIHGALIVGLLLGVVQTLVVAYVSSQLSDAIIFGLLFVVLLVLPTGLFRGLRTPARVARR